MLLFKPLLLVIAFILSPTPAEAFSVDSVLESASSFWKKEKVILVPDFTLTDTQGNVYTEESTKGKYLVINFWATWCPPCLKEIPDFVDFHEKYSDKAIILGLNYEQASSDAISEFTESFMVEYPIVLFSGKNSTQFENFGNIVGMPTTRIYNPKGELIGSYEGAMDLNTLINTISAD
jgi:thiol-disulfide isomerase/thioredoxin